MRLRLFLLFFSLLLMLPSCHAAPGTPSHMNFQSECFRAQINGTLYGISFSAEIGQTEAAGGRAAYIKYLSPASLSEILIQREETGSYSLCLDGIYTHVTSEEIYGLSLPLRLLLEEEEILRVQKTEAGTELQLPNNVSLLTCKGYPRQVTSPDASFEVVWWEKNLTN